MFTDEFIGIGLTNISPARGDVALEALDTVKSLRPDDNGYYRILLGIIDSESRNTTVYDKQTTVKAITDPSSSFKQNLDLGFIYGEYGHPDRESPHARINKMEPTLLSHHIKSIDLVDLPGGKVAIYGLITPYGPYSQWLQESLMNPNLNTAFSLRGFSKYVRKGDTLYGYMLKLVTFDFVTSPGFVEATKFHTLSMEDCVRPIEANEYLHGIIGVSGVSLEELEYDPILKEFGISPSNILDQVNGVIDPKNGKLYINSKDRPRSAVHDMLSCRGN